MASEAAETDVSRAGDVKKRTASTGRSGGLHDGALLGSWAAGEGWERRHPVLPEAQPGSQLADDVLRRLPA
eukprot:scaffold489826_cov45-Prasinocladus_malaysianus.AAC.1